MRGCKIIRRSATEVPDVEGSTKCANCIGRTADGWLHLLTNPLVPALGANLGREFLGPYVFGMDGSLLDAK
jgi:hypothetical protein